MHIFHKWSKWEEETRVEISTSPNFGPNAGKWFPDGFAVVQKRTCEICGLTERKRDEISR